MSFWNNNMRVKWHYVLPFPIDTMFNVLTDYIIQFIVLT
jgi:hypothetical protein